MYSTRISTVFFKFNFLHSARTFNGIGINSVRDVMPSVAQISITNARIYDIIVCSAPTLAGVLFRIALPIVSNGLLFHLLFYLKMTDLAPKRRPFNFNENAVA